MFKLIKFILKVVLILFVILIIALGVFVFMLYDNNFSEPDYLKDSSEVEFIMNDFISKGLEDSKVDKKVDIVLSEEELSVILKTISNEINKTASGITIKTAYVDVTEAKTVNFISYFAVLGFNSSLKGDFDYDIIDKNIVFNIKKISVGNVEFRASYLSSLDLNSYLKEELKDSWIKISVDSNGLTISISLDSLVDSLKEENNIKDKELFQALLSLVIRNEDIIKVTESNSDIGINIDLEYLNYDNSVDAALPYTIDFDDVSRKLEQLLNNNIISIDNINVVGTYLVKGYSKLTDEEKQIIKDIDLSSVGILIKELYQGVIEYEKQTIIDVFTNQYTGVFSGLKLTEKNWNDILLQEDLVGEMYCFARKDNDFYKVTYIAVESLFVDINENKLDLYMTVSVNGESLVLNIAADESETLGLNIEFSINIVRFGTVKLNDDEIKLLLNYLENNIDEDWIVVNKEANEIDIDFIGVFESSPTLSLILQIPGINPTVKFMDGYVLID